ncbi:MAG TPA: MBL fold metallo-hydrolase, partial [Terriglobales bacterium]
GYTIRAVAIEDGHTNSGVSDFEYVIDRRDRTAYVSEEILPGVRMIRDSDNDKMFLIQGTTKAVLIDSGEGRGALKAYLSKFTGGLPLEVIFTHNHGDHIGQADQFVRTSDELIGAPDRAGLVRFLKGRGIPDAVIAEHVKTAQDGERVAIGGRSLVLYAAPGHTPGSMVIFDLKTGNLFSGDAFGSNSPTIPDALWMQFDHQPLDLYWSMIKRVRAELGPNVKEMMTGHNDRPLTGPAYMDNLESALRQLMGKGNAALVPSYRPLGMKQIQVGDRFHDPNWVAINVSLDHYLPAPVDQIDGLVWLDVAGAKLTPEFSPDIKDYTATLPRAAANFKSLKVTADPTSSRSTLTIDGEAAAVGTPLTLTPAPGKITVSVKSPDGTQTAAYTVTISQP